MIFDDIFQHEDEYAELFLDWIEKYERPDRY